MKKLLFLLLLVPSLSFSQSLDQWDVVREGYFKVVVGQDTLTDNFTRYDTALKFAHDYAEDSAQGAPIRIISPDYRFEYSYLQDQTYTDTTTVQLSSLLLKDMSWGHSTTTERNDYDLRVYGESIADSVRFQYFGQDSTGVKVDTVSWQVPQNGTVSDTLTTDFKGIIQIELEAYYGTDFYRELMQFDAELISSLGVKKKTNQWQKDISK